MMTGAFKATYVFGYIVACMFVIFFLVLVAAPSEFVGEQKQGPRWVDPQLMLPEGGSAACWVAVHRLHCTACSNCCLLTARAGRSRVARQQAAQQGVPLTPRVFVCVCRLP